MPRLKDLKIYLPFQPVILPDSFLRTAAAIDLPNGNRFNHRKHSVQISDLVSDGDGEGTRRNRETSPR